MKLAPGVLAIALLLGASTADAAAQDARDAEAESLFKAGMALQNKGDTAGACALFEQSQAATSAVGTLIELTWCYELDGRVLRAWQAAVEAEKLAKTRKDTRAAGARTRVADLERRLARLVIRAAGAPDGAAITLDGAPYESALLGVAVPLELGAHRVVATAPGHDRFEQRVELVEGTTSTVEIAMVVTAVRDPVVPDPRTRPETDRETDRETDPRTGLVKPAGGAKPVTPPRPRAEATSRGGSRRRMFGLVSIGAGALALGGAAGLGLLAKGDYDGAFDDGHCDRETLGCDAEGEAITSGARTKAHVATAIGVVGLGAVAAGVILYLTAPGDASDRQRERERRAYLVPVVGDGAVGLVLGGSL